MIFCVFKLAALGVDPFQSLMAGLDALIPIEFGTLYVIVNIVLLLFSLIADRHHRDMLRLRPLHDGGSGRLDL